MAEFVVTWFQVYIDLDLEVIASPNVCFDYFGSIVAMEPMMISSCIGL